MKAKHRRMAFVGAGLALLGLAALLAFTALRDNVVFFFTPSEALARTIGENQRLRLGGLVEDGSVVRTPGSAGVQFRITDLGHTIPVRFEGLLPDLFREGQGVVAEGRMVQGTLIADEVLAKHDENYMPANVAEALKRSGQWKPADAK